MDFLHPLSYLTPKDHAEIAAAGTYESLRDIAIRVLHAMPTQASMVCGPISTGGLGSIEDNLSRFNHAISLLVSCNVNVFTQMPFEEAIRRIRGTELPYQSGLTLLETFYLPIFRSGRVSRLCFLPDWETSLGTKWEHKQGIELRLELTYFRDNFESQGTNITLLFK